MFLIIYKELLIETDAAGRRRHENFLPQVVQAQNGDGTWNALIAQVYQQAGKGGDLPTRFPDLMQDGDILNWCMERAAAPEGLLENFKSLKVFFDGLKEEVWRADEEQLEEIQALVYAAKDNADMTQADSIIITSWGGGKKRKTRKHKMKKKRTKKNNKFDKYRKSRNRKKKKRKSKNRRKRKY